MSATAGISQATGYRYLYEGIDVLADQAADLHEVPDRGRREGMTQCRQAPTPWKTRYYRSNAVSWVGCSMT